MGRARWAVWLGVALIGCDDGGAGAPADGADAGVGGCNLPALVAQCPLGTSPAAGEQAEARCAEAVGGLTRDGQDAVSGQCQGAEGCRVLCQFAVPCACGVESVTSDGVICASCEGAAACGNGRCEGGEDPVNCPIDCGPECEGDERRCDGTALEECNLQGRWDRLPCPAGEICVVEGGAHCDRDPSVIVGGDAGVGDGGGGPVVEDRIIRGDGTWPAVVAAAGGLSPAATYRSFNATIWLDDRSNVQRPTNFARAMSEVGRCLAFIPGPGDSIECLGPNGSFRATADGQILPADQGITFDIEEFCANYDTCQRGAIDDCAAFVEMQRAVQGDTRVNCWAEALPERCIVLAGIGCEERWRTPYPEDTVFIGSGFFGTPTRLFGIANGQREGLMVDRGARTQAVMDAVGEFSLRLIAVSADERTVAYTAMAQRDEAVVVWHPDAGDRVALLPVSGGSTNRFALGPDGQVLAVLRQNTGDPAVDNQLALYNIAEEKRIYSIVPTEGDSFGGGGPVVAFSPDGVLLALLVQPRQRIEIWDVVARVKRHTLEGDGMSPVLGFTFSPDGRYLLAHEGSVNGPLNVWSMANGRRVQTIPAGLGAQGRLAFDTDGAHGVIGGVGPGAASFTLIQP
ncbi:MAG: hypothetical protein KC549_19170 [Myxococcales bacterium]|nr:hypothetical protein [Myxococcales bacterium]